MIRRLREAMVTNSEVSHDLPDKPASHNDLTNTTAPDSESSDKPA